MTIQEKIDKRIEDVGGSKKIIEGLIDHYPSETTNYGCIFEGFILARYKPWDITPTYKEMYRTALSNDRMYIIDQYSSNMYKQFPDAPMAEFGVYTGGVTCMLLDKGIKVFAFDTFCGIKQANARHDAHENGEYAVGDVQGTLDYIQGAVIIEGEIPFTLSQVDEKFSFCHIDLDVYRATHQALWYAYQNILPGGVIICDDYGMETCKGVKQAIDEIMVGNKVYLPTGQMVIQKPC